MARFTYDGNDQDSYSIFDNERTEAPIILTAHMGEDCVLQLIHVLNENASEIITSQ